MLVRLFGENFRSFRDPFELSMIAADLTNDQDKDRGFFEVHPEGLDEPLRLLRCAAIYGANASGKSTVMLAARALLWMARLSARRSEPGDTIESYDSFALSEQNTTAPIDLGCMFISENRLYEYRISFDQFKITYESLTEITAQTTVLIDRNEEGAVGGTLIEKSDTAQAYVSEMQPNISVMSKLALLGPAKGPDSIVPIYESLCSSLRSRDFVSTFGRRPPPFTARRLHQDSDFKDWMLDNLIRPADLGIRDIQIDELVDDEGEPLSKKRPPSMTPYEIGFEHAGSCENSIPFIEESAGTQKLYNLASSWHELAHEDSTLIADELSASLHPRLLEKLIVAINSPSSSKVQSQLIFTCHDTGLLEGRDGSPPALRRDQIYFTEKDKDGASSLFSLTEFKDDARTVHNIRKRYLSGRYGAIPLPEGISL